MKIIIPNGPIDPNEASILVTDGLHCGVEPTGGEIVDYLDTNPIDGVITHRMYPEAVTLGKRYLSSGELGSKFDVAALDGRLFGGLDDDEKAALRFMDECPGQYWLGIDPHTSNSRNANFLMIGDRDVPAATIGVAGVLGLRNVVVMPDYPFFTVFRRFASIETELAPGINPLSDPQVWHTHLETMSLLGWEGMTKLGMETMRDLRYYMKLELGRLNEDGTVNPAACRFIEQLEDIEQPDGYFAPFTDLPDFLADIVPEGLTVCGGDWGDSNNSPELPEMLGYRKDGRARRVCFGSFLLEIAPPEVKRLPRNNLY